MSPSWYDVLEVEPDATPDDVRDAWRRSIDGLDPTDRRFAIRNQAAAVLLDPAKRAAHDAELAEQDESSSAESDELEARAPVLVTTATPSVAQTTSRSPVRLRKDASPSAVAVPPTPDPTAGRTPRRPVPGWLLVGLALVAVLVAGLGAYVYTGSEPSGAVDDAADQAQQTADVAVEKIFSYDYRDVDGSKLAAESYLTPSFRDDKFGPFFTSLVGDNAAKVKVVNKSVYVDSGVTNAEVDKVDVLEIFNYTFTNAASPQPQVLRQFATLRMVLRDGEWLVNDISTQEIGK